MNRRRFCLQKGGSREQRLRDIAQWLTTIRHVARVPMTQSGYIAPESATPVARVATVVDSGMSATVRKPAISVPWPWPGLACTTVKWHFTLYKGSRDIAQRLTTIRHVACFPTYVRIRCIAPESVKQVVGRVATVVDSGSAATVRKPAIFVPRLWRPGLACSAAPRYWRAADVVSSARWRIAVSTTCKVHAVHHTCNERSRDVELATYPCTWQAPRLAKYAYDKTFVSKLSYVCHGWTVHSATKNSSPKTILLCLV